jgi:hypothetical protein
MLPKVESETEVLVDHTIDQVVVTENIPDEFYSNAQWKDPRDAHLSDRTDPLTAGLRSLGLVGTPFESEQERINRKRIPLQYLTNTRECRLQLLAGLLDSAGHYLPSNRAYIARGLFGSGVVRRCPMVTGMQRANDCCHRDRLE